MPKRDHRPRQETGRQQRAGDGRRSDRAQAGATSAGGTPRAETVSDWLVLAAVARAYRHRSPKGLDVPFGDIIDHLAIARRTKAARNVRAHLAALCDADLVRRSRRHGITVWGLTWAGQRHLERALRSTDPPILPESPQHRAWRNAHDLAGQEIDRFRGQLRATVGDTLELADTDPPTHSDAWFMLAARLQRDAWLLGSATHCLYEWREPTDERADIDTQEEAGEEELPEKERNRRRAHRAGRRNTVLWREKATSADSEGLRS